jgi:hypothetical protein
MILSSIGSILVSLLPPESSHQLPSLISVPADFAPSPLALRSRHILILSLSSTAARLLAGVIADYLSPIIPPPEGSRRVLVKRSTLAAGCVTALLAVFLWGAIGLKSERGLWVISAGVGSMYGAVFTLT